MRGGLLGGCLAVLLAGTCFSVPFFKIELGPLPLTADRVLLVLLVGQYVFWRRWGLADPKPLGKPEIILLAVHRRDGAEHVQRRLGGDQLSAGRLADRSTT